jgi:hypothetical protein
VEGQKEEALKPGNGQNIFSQILLYFMILDLIYCTATDLSLVIMNIILLLLGT